jgi:hypothetical protein
MTVKGLKFKSVLLSGTYHYDLLCGEVTRGGVPQSNIISVKKYEEMVKGEE